MFMYIFLLLIISPFLYLLYNFRYIQKKYKITYLIISFLSFLFMYIKASFQPTHPLFLILILLSQIYIISIIVFTIISTIYQIILFFINKKTQKNICILLLIFSLCFTCFGFFTHFYKQETNYTIHIPKVSSLEELNIVTLTDIHLGTGTYIRDIKNIVNELNQKDNDLVFLCGDIFDESSPSSMIEESLKLISTIQTKYGIYAVHGNHEHYGKTIDLSLYQKNNIEYLDEKYVCIDNLFNIVGRDDISSTNKSMQEICVNMNTSLPTFILDHNPKRYLEAMEYADLQFSGHTHGGQFFPMTLATTPLYDNAYGLMTKNDFSLIVSSGYGSWGFPFRFLTNCEIIYTKVTFDKKQN